MKVTFEQLFDYNRAAQGWLQRDPAHAQTKLGYAISRVDARVRKAMKRYDRRVKDIQADNCATDDRGVILTEVGSGLFRFKPEGLKAVNLAVEKLEDEEMEIEPYYAAELPTDLTDFEREILSGFVIREQVEEVAV